MESDLAGMRYYLVVVVHVGRPEVDDDVHHKHDVDCRGEREWKGEEEEEELMSCDSFECGD